MHCGLPTFDGAARSARCHWGRPGEGVAADDGRTVVAAGPWQRNERTVARLPYFVIGSGTPGGTRTPDAQLRTLPLYPLSYRGMVPCGELVWWRQGGSNPQPRHCERRALPIELCPHDEPIKVKTSRRLMSNRMAARRLMSSCRRPPIRVIPFGRRDPVSAQGIECSYPGRADVKWMRILSGKKGTEFSPRVPIDSHIARKFALFPI